MGGSISTIARCLYRLDRYSTGHGQRSSRLVRACHRRAHTLIPLGLMAALMGSLGESCVPSAALPEPGNDNIEVVEALYTAEEAWEFLSPEEAAHYIETHGVVSRQRPDTMVAAWTDGVACRSASAGLWQSVRMDAHAGIMSVEFDAKPLQSAIDGLIGLASGVGTSFQDYAVLVRFSVNNTIDARSGNTYRAVASVPYSPGVVYHFRLDVDVTKRLYSVYVTPQGGTERLIAQDFPFRNEQAAVTQLDTYGIYARVNGLEVCNFATGAATCITSTAAWQSFPMASSTGIFTAEFDAIPNHANMDGLTALSGTAVAQSSDFVAAVRFNTEGRIDAFKPDAVNPWTGTATGWYAADRAITYTPGTVYHFRIVLNVSARTYSVYVTPAGAVEQQLAANYGFRTPVSSVNYWAAWAGTGSHRVCSLNVVNGAQNQLPAAVAAATPSNGTAPLSVGFDGSASTDPDGTIVSYGWNFGDGQVGSGAQAAHTYAVEGDYTAVLTVTDDFGDTATASVVVSVDPAANSCITSTPAWQSFPTTPCAGVVMAEFDAIPNNANIDAVTGLSATAATQAADLAVAVRFNTEGRIDVFKAGATNPWTGAATGWYAADRMISYTPGQTYHFRVVADIPAGTYSTYVTPLGAAEQLLAANCGFRTPAASLNYLAVWAGIGSHRVCDFEAYSDPGNQLPAAAATATPSSGIAPLTVSFDGRGSSDPDGTVVAYAWDFGDGQSGTGAQATHVYQTAGKYSATLTVTDDRGGINTASVTVTVAGNLPPTAVATATPSSGTAPLNVSFDGRGSTDTDGTIVSYSWNFGDGQNGTGAQVSHSYATAGNYTARLTVTDDLGATASANAVISVTSANACVTSTSAWQSFPMASFSGVFTAEYDAIPNTADMDGLTGLSAAAVAQTADLPVAIRFNTEGKIDAFKAGAVNPYTGAPTGWYAADKTISYTVGLSYHFRVVVNISAQTYSVYVTPTGGVEQQVAANYGFRTQATSLRYLAIWAMAGSHQVCDFTAVSGGTNQVPTVDAGADQILTLPTDTVTLNGQVFDDGLPAPPGAVTVTWSQLSGPAPVSFGSANAAATSARFSAAGTYQLQLAANDGALSASDSVLVYVIPSLNISASPSSGTAPLTVTFTAMQGTAPATTLPAGSTLNWDFGDGTPGAGGNQVTHVFTSSGSYVVSLSIALAGGLGTQQLTTKSVSVSGSGNAQPMVTASRTSGVAPLAVFFDAVNPATGVVQPPLVNNRKEYADMFYQWDFGDPGSGNWSAGRKNSDGTYPSRNKATGYVAAHVFENPGTYTVKLRVVNPSGQSYDYEQTITVQAFSGTTYYVSSAGSDSNNGTSTSTPFASWSKGISTLFASNGPRRVLFRRGDVFNTSSGYSTSGKTGPYILGSYGSGANPIIRATHTSTTLAMSTTVSDVRVMDIDFEGQYPSTPGMGLTIGVKCLVLRSRISKHDYGIINQPQRRDENVVANCTFLNHRKYGIYMFYGQHNAVLGCTLDQVAQEHLIRCWISRSVIQNCSFGRGAYTKHQLKFIGLSPAESDLGGKTEYAIVSDNLFERSGPIWWMITLGPQDEAHDERIENMLFERNVVRSDVAATMALRASGRYITIRNNVFNVTGADGPLAVYVGPRGIEPSTLGTNLFNNTFYRGDSSQWTVTLCEISGSASSTTLRNNLVYGPNARLNDGTGSGLTADHNLVTTNPRFAAPSSGDFRLLSGSPAIDVGAAIVGIRQDATTSPRPVDGNGSSSAEWDLGAYEFVP